MHQEEPIDPRTLRGCHQFLEYFSDLSSMGRKLYDELNTLEMDDWLQRPLLEWSAETKSAFEDVKDQCPPGELQEKLRRFADVMDRDAFTRGFMAGRMHLIPGKGPS